MLERVHLHVDVTLGHTMVLTLKGHPITLLLELQGSCNVSPRTDGLCAVSARRCGDQGVLPPGNGGAEFPHENFRLLHQLLPPSIGQISNLFGVPPVGLLLSTLAPQWPALTLGLGTRDGAQISHLHVPVR